MDFKDALSSGCYCLDIKSGTKHGVIEELVDLMITSGAISDREDVLGAILAREKKMSTGLQEGVAVPHGKSASIDDLVSAVGIKKEGVDFDSLDGKLSRIFVMTVSPMSSAGPHLQYLGEITRILKNADARERLLTAGSRQEIVDILTGA